MPRIRVLIIDDSVVIRRLLAESLARDEDLEVVGKASSGRLGLAKLHQISPDVVALDANMPEMDGLDTLREIRRTHPRLPVVMLCKATTDGAARARDALAAGASGHVVKPDSSASTATQIQRLHDELAPKIKALCASVIEGTTPPAHRTTPPGDLVAPRAAPAAHHPADRGAAGLVPRLIARQLAPSAALRALCARRTTDAARGDAAKTLVGGASHGIARPAAPQHTHDPSGEPRAAPPASSRGVLAIASSTGGPAALAAVLAELPASFPLPVVIAQHMPPMFTRLLAERLSLRCPLAVHEAQGGEILRPGTAWIAPGDHHLVLEHGPAGLELRLNQEPHENSCRPSADVLFRSVATTCGVDAIALVLTGMGQDGLNGCRWIKERRGRVIVQDQETSVVWGMPGYVARAGIADRVVPLQHVASELLRMTDDHAAARIAHVVGANS